jgi:23S rRNA (pseudouridine1915-N3)-methyltransferase
MRKVLQIKVVAVGKIRDAYWQDALREYIKRLSSYVRLKLIEVSDEPCPDRLSTAEEERVKNREGERILKALTDSEYTVLLDIQGKQYDSVGFSQFLDELGLRGRSKIVFIIGGSLGVSQSVRERSDFSLSFSRLTFPHGLMRVLLLEQLYRAIKISEGGTYHK